MRYSKEAIDESQKYSPEDYFENVKGSFGLLWQKLSRIKDDSPLN